MPKYWMVTNRNKTGAGLGRDRAKEVSYWIADAGPLKQFASWREVKPSKTITAADKFSGLLAAAANRFPLIKDPDANEAQKHVSLFIHGYNNNWADAADRYEQICQKIFGSAGELGICVLFSWPSDGMQLGYLPDRMDAEKTAPDLSAVFNELYDWMVRKQTDGATDPANACHAKTSVIAHSMGNFVLQKAMQYTWTRKNQPLLVSLVNQMLMVAADVDNDLFNGGEAVNQGDGDAIANLTYRITALYTGRDPVLGLSAGFKHFGKRRLGRSGLDTSARPPDNVWGVDCSSLISPDASNIHSSYFNEEKTIELMQWLLRGVDREVIKAKIKAMEGSS